MRKKLLFIGINYYAYVGRLRDAFEQAGYDVDYREIEPVDFLSKTRKKFMPSMYWRRLADYHNRIIDEAADTQYDIVLFIQVHHFAPAQIDRLRSSQRNATFVLYNWDSLTTHDYRPWLGYFDKVSTFDPADAEALDVNYLPLFALDDYFEADQRRTKDFDLYFVGAIGTFYRFDALAKLSSYCHDRDIRVFFHLKCSPLMMIRLLLSGRRLPGMTFRSLGFAGIIDLIERSRCVFDFANHRQSGYTMRLIENMCAGLKVVTENPRVEGEDFYRADRFLVLKDVDFKNLQSFIERPITSHLDTEQFRIGSWVSKLLS
ncbi:MAG: hypothetical protein V4618_04795 [Pseudomonadota bacterium]